MSQLISGWWTWKLVTFTDNTNVFANLMLVSWLVNLLVSVVAVRSETTGYGLVYYTENAQGQLGDSFAGKSKWSQVLVTLLNSQKATERCNCYLCIWLKRYTWSTKTVLTLTFWQTSRKTSLTRLTKYAAEKTNCYFTKDLYGLTRW